MNLKWRIRFTRLAIGVMRVRASCRWLLVHLVLLVGNLVVASIKRKNHHRVEALKKAVETLTAKTNSFCAECRAAGERPTEMLRQYLLATQSGLNAEIERLRTATLELKSPHPAVAAAVLTDVLTAMQCGLFRSQRKHEALSRLISQIDNSATFHWDLLLWFVIPHSYSEVLVGDLAEEFKLRSEADGEGFARAWYRDQVRRTVVEHLWKKVERLAAIGTLIDFISRFFGK